MGGGTRDHTPLVCVKESVLCLELLALEASNGARVLKSQIWGEERVAMFEENELGFPNLGFYSHYSRICTWAGF